MVKLRHDSDTMLVITTLHNGMIFSILSISSHGFVLDFIKSSRTNRDILLTVTLYLEKMVSVVKK